jgi:hypothetical protein
MTPTVADNYAGQRLIVAGEMVLHRMRSSFSTTTLSRSPSSTVPPLIDLLHGRLSQDRRYLGDGWPDPTGLQHPRCQWATFSKSSLCGAAPQMPVVEKGEGELRARMSSRELAHAGIS